LPKKETPFAQGRGGGQRYPRDNAPRTMGINDFHKKIHPGQYKSMISLRKCLPGQCKSMISLINDFLKKINPRTMKINDFLKKMHPG
jgi:hypothetical protein